MSTFDEDIDPITGEFYSDMDPEAFYTIMARSREGGEWHDVTTASVFDMDDARDFLGRARVHPAYATVILTVAQITPEQAVWRMNSHDE